MQWQRVSLLPKGDREVLCDRREYKDYKGNETVTLVDLKAGTKVLIEAKKEGDKLIASTIKVSAPKAAPVKK